MHGRSLDWATSAPTALVALLLLRIGTQTALYLHGFMALTADELSRTVVAARWAEHPALYWQGEWLPFHAYLFGSALVLHGDLLWVPRLISMAFGCASIVMMYLVGSTVFQSRAVGLISAFLLAVNPAHTWLSSVPLTEVPSAMLVLAAIAAFAAYLNSPRPMHLGLAAGALALANGFRFESWLVTGLFSLWICLDSGARLVARHRHGAADDGTSRLGLAAFAALVPWIVPAGWLAGNYTATGNPLAFMDAIDRYKAEWYEGEAAFGNYIDAFLTIDPYVTAVGLAALLACWVVNRRSAAAHWYVAATILPFLAYVLVHGGRAEPFPNYLRYFTPFIILLYPAMAYWVDRFTRTVPRRGLLGALLVTLIAVVGTTRVLQTFDYTNDPVAQGLPVGQAIQQLRAEHADTGVRPVMVELQYWQYLAVHVGASDLHTVIFDRTVEPATRDSESVLLTDVELFRTCLKMYDVSHVVLKSEELRQTFEAAFELLPMMDVDGYAFYPIPVATLDDVVIDASSSCPLPSRSFADPPKF